MPRATPVRVARRRLHVGRDLDRRVGRELLHREAGADVGRDAVEAAGVDDARAARLRRRVVSLEDGVDEGALAGQVQVVRARRGARRDDALPVAEVGSDGRQQDPRRRRRAPRARPRRRRPATARPSASAPGTSTARARRTASSFSGERPASARLSSRPRMRPSRYAAARRPVKPVAPKTATSWRALRRHRIPRRSRPTACERYASESTSSTPSRRHSRK